MSRNNICKRLLSSLRPFTGWLLLSILFSLIYVIATLLIPYFIGGVIDLLANNQSIEMNKIAAKLLFIALSIVAAVLSNYLMNICSNRLCFSMTSTLRKQVFDHVQALPLSYLDKKGTGDILSRMVNDIDSLSDGLLLGFTTIFTGVMTIIWTLVMMVIMNWFMAIIVIVLTPLSLFISKFIAKNISSYFKKQSVAKAEQTAFIEEMIPNCSLISSFNKKEDCQEKFEEQSKILEKVSIKAMFFSSLVNPTTRFVNAIVYAVIAFIGALVVIQTINIPSAVLTVGALTTFLSYASQYSKPFNDVSAVITELENAITCAQRVYELLDEEKEIDGTNELKNVRGDIDIQNVYFSYVENKRLIENFNLSVKKGEKIAIVGPTGCGKTTLINLLMRFYDVNDGSICFDGNDVRKLTRASVHQNIGMVLQETWLRYGTVMENITLGKSIPEEEVIEACKKCHAHDFIIKMENGYNTILEENGGSLSQGQKQLLCIARVMCNVPDLLILDEATSSIDTRTELMIQDAFDQMMKGRTSFLVAHRLSTIRSADVILVMNEGHIIEQGNHDELLQKKGFYYNLYNAQFEK